MVSAELKTLLSGNGRRVVYDDGDVLFLEGDRPRNVLLVEAGQVRVVRGSVHGETVTIAHRGPGELLGELACIDDQPRSASVIARGRVEATAIPVGQFRELLRRHAELAYAVLESAVARIRESDRRRVEYGTLTAEYRVARALVDHARPAPDGSGAVAATSLTQRELADITGTSRESVGRALRALREAGLVVTRRGTVLITDLDALNRRSYR